MLNKIIIDTDPAMGSVGGDPEDSFAILLALNSPEIEVEGITIVQGNVPVERGYSNAAYLLDALGRSIPLHPGPPHTLTPARSQQRIRLSQREGMQQIAPLRDPAEQNVSAAEFIVETCLAAPGEVALVTIGPLTNVAIALQSEPALAAAIPHITMMAGAARVPGNITPSAEFNVWADPDAADVVFRSGIALRMVPLDVCHRTRMGRDELQRVGENPHPLCQFIQASVKPWIDARTRLGEHGAFHLYDSLAMAAMLEPEIVRCRSAYVAVETEGRHTTGATVCEFNESIVGRMRPREPNAEIALEVDVEAFNALFNDRVIEFLRRLGN